LPFVKLTLPRLLWVLLALMPWGAALAHPHGTMQCSLRVAFEAGRPTLLSGRLLMDAAHSKEMQAMLRDPATGLVDAQRQQRFMFSLKIQLARSNWLLGAQAGGVETQLSAAREPVLVLAEDGRVGVDVALRIEPAAAVAADKPLDMAISARAQTSVNAQIQPNTNTNGPWQFFCADPTFYWVTEFAAPAAPLAIDGCAAPVHSPAMSVTTGPRAGSVLVEMRCGD
jgi:hypothetical protein